MMDGGWWLMFDSSTFKHETNTLNVWKQFMHTINFGHIWHDPNQAIKEQSFLSRLMES